MTAPGVLIAPEALDELLTLASASHFATSAAGALAEGGHGALAAEHSQRATADLVKLCKRLEDLGGRDLAPIVKPAPVDALAELARVESSRAEALALLDALRHAHQLAEALDAKRGDVLDEPVGGSAGLVWGDRLIQAVSGLELELFGPGEAVTGARE